MKQQPWLISYRYRSIDTFIDGRSSTSEPYDSIEIVDVPPWRMLVDAKLKIRSVESGKNPDHEHIRRSTEILAIYWAVQLPIGAMTDEEIEMFQ